MPLIRPFRALRYEPDAVGDLSLVVSPPYDVVGTVQHQRLLARHPKNSVRLDLPADEPGDEPDARYRRAARTFAAWRSDGTFHKDPRPTVYVYEQTYRVPGTEAERVQRGFFARLRLEPFGAGGVLPHERTLSAPREDRYKLIRATGANFSPVVCLFADPSGRTSDVLETVTSRSPTVDIHDDEGVRHRLWVVPVDGAPAEQDGIGDAVAELLALASTASVTIADGHHRYETALRYRDERRMTRSCEENPAFDYILALFLESAGQPLTVLPTHRIARLVDDRGAGLTLRAAELFDVRPATRDELDSRFEGAALAPGGAGRIGLWTREGGALLEARRASFDSFVPAGHDALRRLDVTLVGVALEHLAAIDPTAIAAGRLRYTKSAREALAAVDACADGADAAFLLEPTPVRDISAVAAAGDVMPQKSTYFYPKPLTGLVINPHEW